MELRHLRYFVAVAEELNFTRAAAVLQMSQPPLSQQISQLEGELGVQLFERGPRHVALTDAGEIVLAEARRVLAGVGELKQVAAGAIGGLTSRPLRLGCIPSGFTELLPAVVPVFRRRNPAVTLLISSLDIYDQTRALRRGELDIGVLRAIDEIPGILTSPIEEQPFVAAIHQEHPLADTAAVRLADLAAEDFIFIARRRGPEYVDTITGACRSAGFSPRVTFEPDDDQTILGLVACGMGVGIVPRPVSRLSLPGVVYRDLVEPTPTMTLCLAQAANRPSTYYGELLSIIASDT